MAWNDKVREYRAAGFTYDEIMDEAAKRRVEYQDQGFTTEQIDEYFGNFTPEDKFKGADEAVVGSFAKLREGTENYEPDPSVSKNVLQALEAGFDMSATGLIGGRPDMHLKDQAKLVDRIAYGAGMLAGDLPFSLAGGAAGGLAAAETGPGAIVAAGAGGMALPEAVRKVYVDYYDKGGVSSPRDLAQRVVETAWETGKAAVLGAVTAGAGKAAQVGTKSLGGSRGLQTASQLASEVGIMTTLSHAIEGELPTTESLIDAGVLTVLTHGAVSAGGAANKLRLQKQAEKNILRHWRDTGEKPGDAAARAQQDATFRERMLSDDPTIDAPSTVELRDGSASLTVAPRKKPSPAEGKEVLTDPTGQTAPEDVVLSAFTKRDNSVPFTEQLHNAYREMFNEAHPFNRMVDAIDNGAKSLEAQDVKTLMESTYYSAPRAEFAMKNGIAGSRSLDDIIPKDAENLKNFRALVGALHAEELAAKQIETPVPRAEAQATIAKLSKNKELSKAARDFTDFNNRLLDELVDGGLIARETADKWVSQYEFYAPFQRELEEMPLAGVGSGNKRVFQPKKAQAGSSRKILDPVETTIQNAYSIYQVADRNRAMNALYDFALKNPQVAATWMREKSSQLTKTTLSDAEKQKLGVDVDETVEIWRSVREGAGKNDLVFYRPTKDGVEVKVLEVDPDVAKFISGLDRTDFGVLGDLLAAPNKVFKAGVTLSPEFPIVQVLRDNPWQFIFHKDTPAPFVDLVNGMTHIFANSPTYKSWQAKGGPLATIRNIGDTYQRGHFLQRYDDRSSQWATARNVVSSPLVAMKMWADFWANAPRVGAYDRALKAGKSDTQALKTARDAQLNFMKQGAVARSLNRVMPFFSPTMNALDQMVRSTMKDPASVAWRGAAVITLPVLTAWAAYHDEEWYKELPQWQKDQSVPFRVGDTTYLVPLPPGVGVLFGGLPRRMAESMVDENPHALDGLIESLLVSFTPAIEISAFTPIIEQVANYSFFRQRPLTPDRLRDALPEDQYTSYTTETAKLISQALSDFPLGNSAPNPIVVENYVSSWLGTSGRNALRIADEALIRSGAVKKAPRPTPTIDDLPFVTRFTTYFPSQQSASLIQYYKDLGTYNKVMGSVRLAQDRLVIEPNAPARLKELYDRYPREMLFMAQTREGLGEMKDLIALVEANPSMPPDEKRRLIDQTTRLMITVARQANDYYQVVGDKLSDIQEKRQ